jgi:hypothetical protein
MAPNNNRGITYIKPFRSRNRSRSGRSRRNLTIKRKCKEHMVSLKSKSGRKDIMGAGTY